MAFKIKNLSGSALLEGHEINAKPETKQMEILKDGKVVHTVEDYSESALSKCSDWLLSRGLVHASIYTKIFGLDKKA